MKLTLCYLYVVYVLDLGWLECWLVLGCYLRLGSSAFVRLWWFDFDILCSIVVVYLVCSMRCFGCIDCNFFQCSLMKLRWNVWNSWLNILSPRLVVFRLLSSHFERTELFALFLVMSCYDIFDLTILSLRSIFFWGRFPVARWELMCYCELSFDAF